VSAAGVAVVPLAAAPLMTAKVYYPRYDRLTTASRLPVRDSALVLPEMRTLGPISKADSN